MRKFILQTNSESGDHYTYFIQHKTKPTYDELDRFLEVNANDIEDGEVFEHVGSIVEVLEEEYLPIPKKITKKKK